MILYYTSKAAELLLNGMQILTKRTLISLTCSTNLLTLYNKKAGFRKVKKKGLREGFLIPERS